jgi:hypothetical protein
MVHHLLNRNLLHDLDDERHPFCSLTMMETDHGKLAMRRRRESSTIVAGETSDSALALGTTLVAVLMAEGPPPRGGLAWEGLVQRVNSVAVKGRWWLGFCLARAWGAFYL